jgi:hypothetical protein
MGQEKRQRGIELLSPLFIQRAPVGYHADGGGL